MRLLDKPGDHEGITASYEATLKALAITDADSALVATGRAVARQIDYALRHGQGQEVTKALYLVPHLMNVLRELGATPAARKQLKEYAGAAAAESDSEPVDVPSPQVRHLDLGGSEQPCRSITAAPNRGCGRSRCASSPRTHPWASRSSTTLARSCTSNSTRGSSGCSSTRWSCWRTGSPTGTGASSCSSAGRTARPWWPACSPHGGCTWTANATPTACPR